MESSNLSDSIRIKHIEEVCHDLYLIQSRYELTDEELIIAIKQALIYMQYDKANG